MASNGTRGATFERHCRTVLEAAGYIVIRSAASKTGVDLVALLGYDHWQTPAGRPLSMLVQCKTNFRLDPSEWTALWRLGFASGVTPVLAGRERAGRRLLPAFYRLDGPKVPHARNPPMTRIELPGVTDDGPLG